MKKKRKLIHRIGALLCALVIAVSAFGVGVPYYAITISSSHDDVTELRDGDFLSHMDSLDYDYDLTEHGVVIDESIISGKYYTIWLNLSLSKILMYVSDEPQYFACSLDSSSNLYLWHSYADDGSLGYEYDFDSNSWNKTSSRPNPCLRGLIYNSDGSLKKVFVNSSMYLLKSSHDMRSSSGLLMYRVSNSGDEEFNGEIGYLQNVKRTRTYERGALYNYDEDSLTYHFYHDLESTTGVDLSSGNYVVRHYVANATVKGYEEEDIIEMSEKVLGGEYDASQGYFSYLDKEYDEKLIDSGFEFPGFFDTLFGQFVLQHHYLQIVNLDTNKMGGYLHLYPKDETGDFGVELVYEGLDNNFEVDDTLESGVVKESEGSGLTHEEALQNAEEKEKNSIDLSGVDELTGVLKSYASQIGNVTNGIGALLSFLPPFMVIGLGIGVSLLVLVIIVKVIRG